MKKLNKVAMLFASAALASAAGAQTIDNWKNGTGELVWKNGTNEYCWRDANWTPATAAPGCDGALVPVAAPPAAVVPPAAVTPPAPPAAQVPVANK
ncbi:MAG: OmpA family protein, partial [Proteobacteria bacterium]